MNYIIDKKDFYKMMLKDRLPVARADFPLSAGEWGSISFYSTPMGVAILASIGEGARLREIKLYDKSGGSFALQNVICGENLMELEKGVYISVTSRLHIEDVIDRRFLLKLDPFSINVRASFAPNHSLSIDKSPRLVYN